MPITELCKERASLEEDREHKGAVDMSCLRNIARRAPPLRDVGWVGVLVTFFYRLPAI